MVARARMVRCGLVLLLCGAVVSWLVAWGLAVYRPTDGANVFGTSPLDWNGKYRLPQHRRQTPAGDVFVDVIDGLGYTELLLSPSWARRMKPEDSSMLALYPYPRDVPVDVLKAHGMEGRTRERFRLPKWAPEVKASESAINVRMTAWGWPLRCLAGRELVYASYGADGSLNKLRPEKRSYLDATRGWTSGRVRLLPTRVIWLGLAGNALFWGFVLLLPVAGVRAIRVWQRRGGCAKCGYSLAGLAHDAACPECGAVDARGAPTAAGGLK